MLDSSRLILRGKRQDVVFNIIGILFTMVGIVTLAILVSDLLVDGLPRLSSQFMTSFPSRSPAKAGILSAWVGTLMVITVTLATAVPVGVAAAVYLEEYAAKNWVTTLIEINISNLAGVPSIIYGLMALGLLVYQFHLGRTVLVGGLTLALLVLPIVIVSTREAIRSIPGNIREAAYAAGATKWQVIRFHLIPYSMGGIATGTIIAMSRAIGETAPLITIGALSYVAFLPPPPVQSTAPFVNAAWLNSGFTVLPIQMFNWVSRPQAKFHENAAATGLVLIVFTLAINGVAMYLRYRIRRNLKW
ncbi:Phosphate transport system permease protein PstA [Anatilimnocola aggregata]|uniref:Phosphate transport system permease protein PstA n=1 Tax=Anatilimnocola aggregata TaxID=2528021 RepID=A0A517YEH3_9BACT|nr:phosphate ABC transporter permease PstA [Anatilimnocola aggregata]QDU28601.1 Phosphate transport system permease protein PstA [Anatilimnocola aggregata]